MFYKYNKNKTSFIIKEKYEKYMNSLIDKKKKKNNKIKCDICEKEENINKSKIVLSHFKKHKKNEENEVDLNINEDIAICNKCFKSNISANILNEENTDNNIIIF